MSNSEWHEKFSIFLSDYKDDLPEPAHLTIELKMWEEYLLMFQNAPPTTLSSLLAVTDRMTFPHIHCALILAATIPVTSCTCERSFSVLRRLTTYLRNAMRKDRMNALALLTIHRDLPVDSMEVIERFARRHPRRMKLLDVLNDDPPDESSSIKNLEHLSFVSSHTLRNRQKGNSVLFGLHMDADAFV